MIIIGVDTAIRRTGYGVVAINSASKMSILDCGVISNNQKMLHSECLLRIAGGIEELVGLYHPDAAAVEGAFVCKNVRTAMILSMARGAAITILARHSVPQYCYSPREAKKAVAGNGNASKEQVARMMAAVLEIDIRQIPDDATDALSLAVCHGQIAVRPELSIMLPRPI